MNVWPILSACIINNFIYIVHLHGEEILYQYHVKYESFTFTRNHKQNWSFITCMFKLYGRTWNTGANFIKLKKPNSVVNLSAKFTCMTHMYSVFQQYQKFKRGAPYSQIFFHTLDLEMIRTLHGNSKHALSATISHYIGHTFKRDG